MFHEPSEISETVRRWSIAGTGAVASIGSGVDQFFEALCAGRSGLAPLRGFDAERYRAKYAYEIDDRPATGDVSGRATRWLCDAIAEALREAGIGEDLSEVPVVVGTGLRELRSVELRWTDGVRFPLTRLHFGPILRERFGAPTTYTVNNACSSSLYALGLGLDLLAGGVADTVVVAGTDSITTSMFGLMDRVQRPPVDALRPFDRKRCGALMGDGAGAVVLRRDGPARAWLRSVALNCDAHNETAPDLAGVSAAIVGAHALAGISAADIDVVVTHGTGTGLNDSTEAVALAKTFTSNGVHPLVTAIKSMIGHTSGASGLMSLVAAVEMLRSGRVPPIVTLDEPQDEAQGLRLVTGTQASADLRMAQVDAFGFGGVNAVAIVERAES